VPLIQREAIEAEGRGEKNFYAKNLKLIEKLTIKNVIYIHLADAWVKTTSA
jgi:hypothetical protein